MSLFTKIFGTSSQREVKAITPLVDKIESLEEKYKALTDQQLQAKTPEFKERLQNGETLDDILPEAFAAASNYDDTITLLNNTELAEPLSDPLNDYYISHFTLDLNGKTISCNNGNSDTLFVCATLIICDSSSEKLEGSQKTLILPTGAGRAKNRFPAQLCSHAGNG